MARRYFAQLRITLYIYVYINISEIYNTILALLFQVRGTSTIGAVAIRHEISFQSVEPL
jgi:hypothetical protein